MVLSREGQTFWLDLLIKKIIICPENGSYLSIDAVGPLEFLHTLYQGLGFQVWPGVVFKPKIRLFCGQP